jgi:long-chain fatty acid transport protein
MKNNKIYLSSIVLTTLLMSNSFAGGYSTNLYSTSGLANSYAGSTTGIHDVSDVFFNPANSAFTKNKEFIASVSYLKLNIDADNVSSSAVNNPSEVRNGGADKQIPSIYFASKLNEKSTFALAVTSPFGLATKYDKNWAGKYYAVSSSLSTLNINPSLSYKINDSLAVGGGLQLQYLSTTLTSALSKTSGNDFGTGYNLGLTYKINDAIKLGAGYRSKIDHKLTGNFSSPALGITSDGFNAKTTTPESASLGASLKANERLEFAYDILWTNWSRAKSININLDGGTPLPSKTLNFRDSFLHSLGANIVLSDKTLARFGVAYEKEATSNAYREPSIPVSNKVWVSFGFNYKINKSFSLDAAYLHQFYKNAQINLSDPAVGNLSATYKTKVDVLSIGIKKEF